MQSFQTACLASCRCPPQNALFAVAGFNVAFAREQFLGIDISAWSTQTLTILAGRFTAKMTLFLLGYLVEAWWALLLAAVAIALIVIAFLRLNLPAYAGHAAHAAAALCALTALWARLNP